jgi:thiol-disulfide isomerase/thioredoxin
MKILYINGKNAKSFDKQVDDNVVFAKYFSPSCPACIAMEGEWDSMCKDIDEKYNTDLLLAQIDPHGMSSLENTHTYSDVDYVPHIVILKNGKKVDEYNGPKTKDKMIEYLMNGGYLKSKLSGGKKYKKRPRNRTRRLKKGAGASMSIPTQQENNDIPEEQHIENTLRENTRVSFGQSNTTQNDYIDCIDNGIFNNCKSKSCRKSKGFYNKCIPKNRKFNPNVSGEIKSNAENAYKRLIMLSLFKSKEVQDIIKNNYPEKLNKQLIPIKNQIKDVILEEDYNHIDINDIKGFTEKLQEIILEINIDNNSRIDSADALAGTLQNKIPSKKLNGGKRKNKTMRKRNRIRRSICCIGKRDGKSGCRRCCKSRRNKKRCITRCMRGY